MFSIYLPRNRPCRCLGSPLREWVLGIAAQSCRTRFPVASFVLRGSSARSDDALDQHGVRKGYGEVMTVDIRYIGAFFPPPSMLARGHHLPTTSNVESGVRTVPGFKALTASLCSARRVDAVKRTQRMGTLNSLATRTQCARVSMSALVLSATSNAVTFGQFCVKQENKWCNQEKAVEGEARFAWETWLSQGVYEQVERDGMGYSVISRMMNDTACV